MFRNAARFWGLNDTNIDNFDPLVRLLLEACAVEIYRIDNELASLQRAMTERLAGLLIPEVHTQPRPAHAICHARSTDEYQYIALESQFQHQKRIASVANGPLDTTMDVFFSPAGRYKAIDGDISVLAAGGNIYRIDALQTKETFLRCMPNRPLPQGEIWVGIETKPGVNLTDISFYFDLTGVPNRARYLSMLRHVECECNGQPVRLSRGLSHTSFEDHQLKFEDSLEELYPNRRLEKQINRIYSSQFLTIHEENIFLKSPDATLFMRYPQEFDQHLQPSDLAQMEDSLIWFKLKFPPEFTAELTENLTIGINCFPVVNRHINELSYRLNAYFNIIPLLTSEQFLAVKSVEGTVVGPGG
ncbi:MAG: type VI secretion system baseplate subunit TssF, partial [Bacteroidetes bacterium]|nr:type VI secretion system baseplate subunit TssF [Bacteroidota bacterium]